MQAALIMPLATEATATHDAGREIARFDPPGQVAQEQVGQQEYGELDDERDHGPYHRAGQRYIVGNGACEREREADHGPAKAERGGRIAGFDQRRLVVRRHRHVKDDEDRFGNDGRREVEKEAGDPLKRKNVVHGSHSKKWGTKRLVSVVMAVESSRMPMPAGWLATTHDPITG